MKKQIIILLISVLLTYEGISQTASTDSVTCIPNVQLKKAINLIEKGRVMKEELEIMNGKVVALDSIIISKDKLIKEYKIKNSYSDSIIVGYKQAVINFEKTISNNNISYAIQSVKYQKEKYKKWGTLVLGVLVGILVVK